MQEKKYLIGRVVFFWVFCLAFIVLAPMVVYLSLGYKFDPLTKKMLKTGAISLASFPDGADITLNGRKIGHATPYVLRELLSQKYEVAFDKNGYYPYHVSMEVKPSAVTAIDCVLVPRVDRFDALALNVKVYRFFVTRHLLGMNLIAFTSDGVYSLDSDFKNPQKISFVTLAEETACSLVGLIANDDWLVFWSKSKIWIESLRGRPDASCAANTSPAYETIDEIKNVFFGLKDRYLIVHDGLKLIALDAASPLTFYLLLSLKSKDATVFYDGDAETLYLNDKVPEVNRFSLFKTQLIKLMFFNHENPKN